ncbi:MAG: glycosyltransferase, partial [Armatimonadota bacterium]
MRILFLSQWFDPEPAFKGLCFARELKRRGHEVQVLTGYPNYPGGRIYDGYRVRLLQREDMDGVPVLRVPLYPSHDRSGLRRFANYASFAASAASLGPLVVKPADVAYVYHPPGTIGWPAMVLKALRQIPFVYDIQDLWPDTVTATGMLHNPLAYRLLDGWLRFVYRQAGHITVLSPGFREV